MKLQLISLIILLLLACGSAFGFTYQQYNFGDESTLFDHNNNWAPIDYPEGVGNLPSGGEKYDLEGMNVAMDNEYVYISLTNSFGFSAYSPETNRNYRLGDLFIGVNGADKYGYAIDLNRYGNNGLYQVDSWKNINDKLGSYNYNNAYPEITDQAGAWRMTSGSKLGDVTSTMSFESGLENDFLSSGNGDTYVWEFQFERSLFGIDDIKNLDFHVNLECGNDLIETSHSAIPEPATLLLFGFGLAGIGVARRKKSKK